MQRLLVDTKKRVFIEMLRQDEKRRGNMASPSSSPRTPLLAHQRIRKSIKERSSPLSTPSPAWKNLLKQGCIERARRKRRNRVILARQQPTNMDSDMPMVESYETARRVIEEELQESGVVVYSPVMEIDSFSWLRADKRRQVSPGEGIEFDDKRDEDFLSRTDTSDLLDEWVISESEYYDLMQDVEDELQLEEALFHEEIGEMERCQQQEIQQMEKEISDFEDWESHAARTGHLVLEEEQPNNEDRVVCPVCCCADLVHTSAYTFECQNFSESCTFQIDTKGKGNFNLATFREKFQMVCGRHSELCIGHLLFTTLDQERHTLMATCDTCGAYIQVV